MQNIILIKYPEYKWVKNIISLANKNKYIKNKISNGKLDETCEILSRYSVIDKDGHSAGTITWSVEVSRQILLTNPKIKKNQSGLSYCSKLE